MAEADYVRLEKNRKATRRSILQLIASLIGQQLAGDMSKQTRSGCRLCRAGCRQSPAAAQPLRILSACFLAPKSFRTQTHLLRFCCHASQRSRQLLSLCALPNPLSDRLTGIGAGGDTVTRSCSNLPPLLNPATCNLLQMHLPNPATWSLLDCSSVCRAAAWTPQHCCNSLMNSSLLSFWVQGAILHAPACDAERGLVLRIMAAVQSVLVPVIPYWRLVPVPPLKNVSWDAQVRRAAACSGICCWCCTCPVGLKVSGSTDCFSQQQRVVL